MRQRSRGTKGKNKMTEAQRAAKAAREAKVLKVQLAAGYGIVALSAAAGFLMSPAIGLGLAVLAAIRIYALRKEVRRQNGEPSESDTTPKAPKRPMRTSANRVS